MNLDLIAMHGWAGDQRAWEPWRQAAASRGWSLHTGERGYGRQTPHAPSWPGEGGAVLVHSLGLHLLPSELWSQARAVVLLASFGTFVPPGPGGRRIFSRGAEDVSAAFPDIRAAMDFHAVLDGELLGRVDAGDTLREPAYTDMAHTGSGEGPAEGIHIFSATTPLPLSGSMGYTVRVLPRHPLLAGPAELGLLKLAGLDVAGDAVTSVAAAL